MRQHIVVLHLLLWLSSLTQSTELTSFLCKDTFSMDNRITIILLILLLAISSSHMVCSKHFDSGSSRRPERTSLLLSNPSDPRQTALSAATFAALRAATDSLQQMRTGSAILCRRSFGCLYTQDQLNQTRAALDTYLEELRIFHHPQTTTIRE